MAASDDSDLKEILGYDLGVAITGTERIGLTLIVTEGFGDIAMAERTFDLLNKREGDFAAINGTTQIRAGVMRPEVVIPPQRRRESPRDRAGACQRSAGDRPACAYYSRPVFRAPGRSGGIAARTGAARFGHQERGCCK